MHESTAKRVSELPEKDRPAGLPGDTYLVEGSLEAHGASELAALGSVISANVVSLERTSSGGIKYKFAVLVSKEEPTVEPEPEA